MKKDLLERVTEFLNETGYDHSEQLWWKLLEETRLELQGLYAFKGSVDEALNSGDGSYRP